jgi:hypothetical protein
MKSSHSNDSFELQLTIPYRARGDNVFRKEQLKDFCKFMKTFLTNKNINYRIIILEQDNDLPFNRGILLNAGFLECEKETGSKIKYYCHHNIDLLPGEIIDYSYTPINEIRDIFGYHDGLGGICIINSHDFKKINGFPNNMFGWGSEDVCIKQRVSEFNINIDRTIYNTGVKEIRHQTDSSYNNINIRKLIGNDSGLNNIQYKINNKHVGKILFKDDNDTIEDDCIVHYLIDFDN